MLALLLSCLVATNPVMPGADPHAELYDGTYWVYPTRGAGRFFAYSSKDFSNWTQHGPILSFADIDWIDDDGEPTHYAWAPAVAKRKDRYYFYFSVGPQGRTPARIGVGIGESPKGPFTSIDKPLLTGGNGFEAIDPVVFTDPATQHSYLFAGGSAGATLRVFELGDDMVSLRNEVPTPNPPKFTEGAFVHERYGIYYLSYSHGSWRSSSYSVHYATGKSATGPWTYQGPILTSDWRHKGPGHHSFVKGRGRDEWFIAYHRWNNAAGDGPYRTGGRSIAIERVFYDMDGRIRPITMTDQAPIPSKG